MISFQVLGRPQPAGSKRAFQHPHTGKVVVTDDAKKSRPWKQEVAGIAQIACAGKGLLTGPLKLDITFVMARPKGHFRSGRNAHLLRDSAPPYPAVKPDTTKLIRAVEDALTGIVYRDDAQIVFQTARKVYGAPERVEIRIAELGPNSVAATLLHGQLPFAA